MSGSAAMETLMLESNIQSPSFDAPKYHIAYGKDGTLEWTPPADSRELALALSYHFPKQRGLKRKMRAAIRLFSRTLMERPEQAQPNVTSLSGKKSSSKEEQKNTFQDPETSNVALEIGAVSCTDSSVNSSQLIDVVKTREPILDIVPHSPTISEIIWKAETGEEVQLKPKKRQYTEKERVEVGNNRGNVCKEHRQKKQKCNPLLCPQNKQYQKNNSGWQGVADQRQFTSQEDSNGNLNEYDHNNSTSLDDRIQPSAPKAYPSYRITGVDQPPMVGMSCINVAGLVGSGRDVPNPGSSERFIKIINLNTIKNLTDHPNVLSPAISPGGVESPSSEKSPHVSYFDDAWLDSPYRADVDRNSDSGFEIAQKEHVLSAPTTSICESIKYSLPTPTTDLAKASNMRPQEAEEYGSDPEEIEPRGPEDTFDMPRRYLAAAFKRPRSRIGGMVVNGYITVTETAMTVEGERGETSDSWPEYHALSMQACERNQTSGRGISYGTSSLVDDVNDLTSQFHEMLQL